MMGSYFSKDLKYLHRLLSATQGVGGWDTSSLVGDITRAPRPSYGVHCLRNSISRTGIINAKVFPLPVFAAPRMSFPFNANGSAFRCMSVNVVKCAFFSPDIRTKKKQSVPSCVCWERGNSVNSWTSLFSSLN